MGAPRLLQTFRARERSTFYGTIGTGKTQNVPRAREEYSGRHKWTLMDGGG